MRHIPLHFLVLFGLTVAVSSQSFGPLIKGIETKLINDAVKYFKINKDTFSKDRKIEEPNIVKPNPEEILNSILPTINENPSFSLSLLTEGFPADNSCFVHRTEESDYFINIVYCLKDDQLPGLETGFISEIGPFIISTSEDVILKPSKNSCKSRCIQDPKCVLAYWKPGKENLLCRIQTNTAIPAKFYRGVKFFCKGCKVLHEEVLKGVANGVIELRNVALGKETDASSNYPLDEGGIAESANVVDGLVDTKSFATHWNKQNIDSKEWLMIDLGKQFLVAQIHFYSWTSDWFKAGHLKVFLSNSFDRTDDFSERSSVYTEVLNIPGEPYSLTPLYNTSIITMGRYVVIQRQNLRGMIDFYEVEVMAILEKN